MFKFSKSVRWQNCLNIQAQKKNKLDTDTLLDPGGPLSRHQAKCNRKHQVKADHKSHIFR